VSPSGRSPLAVLIERLRGGRSDLELTDASGGVVSADRWDELGRPPSGGEQSLPPVAVDAIALALGTTAWAVRHCMLTDPTRPDPTRPGPGRCRDAAVSSLTRPHRPRDTAADRAYTRVAEAYSRLNTSTPFSHTAFRRYRRPWRPGRVATALGTFRRRTATPARPHFFVASQADWDSHANVIAGHRAKVMKRINNKAAAVEAVLTRHGTVVGPFMTDLTGYPELTPYQGGWCGNDRFPQALTHDHRAQATDLVQRLGARLGQEGYKGFFEVDILIDLDADEVYLGELNPRISGASSMTNVTEGANTDIPQKTCWERCRAGSGHARSPPGRRRRWGLWGPAWTCLAITSPNEQDPVVHETGRTVGALRVEVAHRRTPLPRVSCGAPLKPSPLAATG
jgi:hypothetical protein